VPVKGYREYVAELAKQVDEPLTMVVRRPLEQSDDGHDSSPDVAARTQELTFEVPQQPMREFGVVMTMGPITALQVDSPAKRAGMKVGDLIVSVDGKPTPHGSPTAGSAPALFRSDTGIDPIMLPDYLQKAAMEGREVEFVVRRGATNKAEGEQLTFRVTPIVATTIQSEVPLESPVAADSVGLAYRVGNEVQAVDASGPASAAGVAVGDRVLSAKIYFPKKKAQDPIDVGFGDERHNWPALVDSIQFAPAGTEVELQLSREGSKEPIKVKFVPQATEGVFIAPRGLVFEPVFRIRQADSFAQAVRYGWDETIDSLTMVFRFLQKLGRQVPFKMLGGPGTIAVAAGDAASQGFSQLLIFLTMLSANLAVVNFLPIPVLDGGHMVFLMYEGLRGRPANEKFVMAMQMTGLAFIVCLMVFVIGLDIQRWIL
jgi:regulator of sigma E protease